jgi:S-DNA-T family DNA segregation ATPase FtsK/SpoIIIE
MLEQRSLKLDLAALALLAVVAFSAVAIATYDPADPPGGAVFPAAIETHNACGQLGAWVAARLFIAFGVGAYYVVLSAAVLDIALLGRRKIGEPILRAIGWALSFIALTTLASMLSPSLASAPAIGPGGYLGATGRGLLEMHFASTGAYILAVSVLIGGLLLSTDYFLVKLSMLLLGTPLKRVASAGRIVSRRDAPATGAANRRTRAAGRSDLDDRATLPEENEEDDDGQTVAIKFPGKPAAKTEKTAAKDAGKKNAKPAAATGNADTELDDDELLGEEHDEDAEDADDEDEADDTAARIKQRLNSSLKIRSPVFKKDEKQTVIDQLEAGSKPADAADYQLPSVELLREGEEFPFETHEKEVRTTAKLLERTFANFGFNIKVVEIQTGPVIAQYEIELEKGLRLSKITGLADDIAIALRVPSVRIVAPIPGKNTVGIEVPNGERQIVRLREIIEEAGPAAAKMKIPIFLGKDVSGHPMTIDLATLPHLLIAGRTGTGKSVCLNSIIVSMLMTRRPDEVRMLMIDPKMVELSPYQRLPHLMHPVVTDMAKAAAILEWAVEKMEERYSLLARAGVRHISNYNQLGEEELMERLTPENDEEREAIPRSLPYIVIVADEMADLMMTSGKEVEQHIIRLAQKSRAVGIHLILATQKPTVDVITGLIKSNLPARIAFQVASRTDSRVVLDEMGADKLLGNGDFLFLWPGTSAIHRGQGTYLSDEEINEVIRFVGQHQPNFVKELVQLKPKDAEGSGIGQFKRRDDLYEQAVDTVVREGRGSVSLLQRSLGIGYGRAARLIDFMAEDGIVGAYNGAQAREVTISVGQWEKMQAASHEEEQPRSRRRPQRSNIRLDAIDDEEERPRRGGKRPTGKKQADDDYDLSEDAEADAIDDDAEELAPPRPRLQAPAASRKAEPAPFDADDAEARDELTDDADDFEDEVDIADEEGADDESAEDDDSADDSGEDDSADEPPPPKSGPRIRAPGVRTRTA